MLPQELLHQIAVPSSPGRTSNYFHRPVRLLSRSFSTDLLYTILPEGYIQLFRSISRPDLQKREPYLLHGVWSVLTVGSTYRWINWDLDQLSQVLWCVIYWRLRGNTSVTREWSNNRWMYCIIRCQHNSETIRYVLCFLLFFVIPLFSTYSAYSHICLIATIATTRATTATSFHISGVTTVYFQVVWQFRCESP